MDCGATKLIVLKVLSARSGGRKYELKKQWQNIFSKLVPHDSTGKNNIPSNGALHGG